MSDHETCDQLGKAHKVDETALQEARDTGGTVTCLECGKAIPQGPRNLEFRASVE